jgi:excisionase family DNA binding protein
MNDANAIQFLSIREVATMLKVHPETLRRWDKEGKLKSVRIGERGHRKYSKVKIEKLLKS